MNKQVFKIIITLGLIIHLISPRGLFAQEVKAPTWVFNVTSKLKINSNDSFFFEGPSVEDFRFNSQLLRSLSPHVLLGLNLTSQLEPRFQFAQLGLDLKYFPATFDRVWSPFAEVSPGAGWNRNRYWAPIGCSSNCDDLAISKRWFFYPLFAVGCTWRPGKGRAALEVKTMYWPAYDAGPRFQRTGEKFSLQASFSYWFQPKNTISK